MTLHFWIGVSKYIYSSSKLSENCIPVFGERSSGLEKLFIIVFIQVFVFSLCKEILIALDETPYLLKCRVNNENATQMFGLYNGLNEHRIYIINIRRSNHKNLDQEYLHNNNDH